MEGKGEGTGRGGEVFVQWAARTSEAFDRNDDDEQEDNDDDEHEDGVMAACSVHLPHCSPSPSSSAQFRL